MSTFTENRPDLDDLEAAAILPVPGYAPAAELEQDLGDPHRPGNRYGFAAAVERDRAGAYPEALAAAGHRAGLSLAFVPERLGGTLDSFDRTLALTRIAARRDASVMPATMFSVTAATCVLLDGNPEQVAQTVATLRAGRSVAFALSEPGSGSDLVTNTCLLQGDPGQRRLEGRKWLVGTGDRAGLLLVIARTAARGMGAFTAVLIDPQRRPAGTVTRSGTSSTGLTGIELSDFSFSGTPVAESELLGRPGRGLATAMQGMQVVRLLSTAANLSCADVAVRTVLDLLQGVHRGGPAVLDWPYTRRELGRIAAGLIAMDVVAITTARAAHTAPAALSLLSAVAKRVVNELSGDLTARCADLAASRGVLAEGPGALLAKVRRDTEVIRYIDTTPVATLRLLGLQLNAVAGAVDPERAGPPAPGAGDRESPELAAFDLGATLPEFDPARLDLAVRGGDPVTTALAAVLDPVRAALARVAGTGSNGTGSNGTGSNGTSLDPDPTPPDPDAAGALAGIEQLVEELARTGTRLRQGRTDRSAAAETAGLDAAARYAELHVGASCVLLWWANRERSLWGGPPGAAGWLRAVLAYLVEDRAGRPVAPADLEPAAALISDLHRRALLFSTVPIPLTDHGRHPRRAT